MASHLTDVDGNSRERRRAAPRAAAGAQSWDALLTRALRQLQEPAAGVVVRYVPPHLGQAAAREGARFGPRAVDANAVPGAADAIRRAGATGQPLYIEDCRGDLGWAALESKARAAYVAPIGAELGTLVMFALSERGLDACCRALVDLVARFAAMVAAEQDDRLSRLDELEAVFAQVARTLRDSRLLSDGSLTSPIGPCVVPDSDTRSKLQGLSRRELEVVRTFCATPEITSVAAALGVSPHTVRNHLKSIFRKLGIHSQIELLSLFSSRSSLVS